MGGMLSKLRSDFYSFARFASRGNREFTPGRPYVNDCRFFSVAGKHVFFGYYDIPQINGSFNRMLATVADAGADPARNSADIGYFDLSDGDCEFIKLATTRAWCWQQGARLRWHPADPGVVLYNDISGNDPAGSNAGGDGYVTKSVDLNGQSPSAIAPALYDISDDFRYGISLNFARLQRFRPGYGYCALPDRTADITAPDNDGVFLVDLHDGSSKLLFSLHDLALKCSSPEGEHYVNHVSFSPDCKKFIFFHVAKRSESIWGRAVHLYSYDIESANLELIEGDWITSHYCWHGTDGLLTTAGKDGIPACFLYNLPAKERTRLEHDLFKTDGHPSFFDNGHSFVYDTYPDKLGYQKLFLFNVQSNEATFLAEFYHTQVRNKDMRCDLHPRLWENGNKKIITADTTCGGLRQIAMLELNV